MFLHFYMMWPISSIHFVPESGMVSERRPENLCRELEASDMGPMLNWRYTGRAS